MTYIPHCDPVIYINVVHGLVPFTFKTVTQNSNIIAYQTDIRVELSSHIIQNIGIMNFEGCGTGYGIF
jgi:hypothetical protein